MYTNTWKQKPTVQHLTIMNTREEKMLEYGIIIKPNVIDASTKEIGPSKKLFNIFSKCKVEVQYLNLSHGASYYILSIFWFWKTKSFLLLSPSSSLQERGSILFFLLFIIEIQERIALDPSKNFIRFIIS